MNYMAFIKICIVFLSLQPVFSTSHDPIHDPQRNGLGLDILEKKIEYLNRYIHRTAAQLEGMYQDRLQTAALKGLIAFHERDIEQKKILFENCQKAYETLERKYDPLAHSQFENEIWSVQQDKIYKNPDELTRWSQFQERRTFHSFLKIQENIQKYITFFNAFNLKKSSEKIDFVKGENKKDLKTLGGSLISNDMSISLKDKLAFIDQIIGNEEMHPEYSSAFLLGIVKKNSPLINPYDQIRLKAAAAKKIVQLEQSLEHMIIANHHIAKMGVGIDASLSLEAVDVLIQKDVPLSLILPLLQDIQILGKVQDERFDPLVLFNRMHGGILQNKMKYHTSEIDRLEKMGVSMDCIFPYFCQTQENEQGLIRHNRALNQEYEGGRDVFNLRKTIEVRKKAGQRLEDLGSHQKLPAEILEENLQKLSLEVADNIWFCPKDRMLAIENLIEGGMAPNEAVPLLLKLIKYENQQMKFSHHAFNISDAKIKALKRLDQFKDHTDEFLQVHECLAQSKSFCALERLESVQVLLEHHHSKADLIPILKDISQNGCVWDPSLSMDHQKTADAKQKAGVMHQDLMRDLVCPKKEI